MRATLAANSSGVCALVSVSTAVSPSPVVSPTEASDLRSSISALWTMRCPAASCSLRISTTARLASPMSLK